MKAKKNMTMIPYKVDNQGPADGRGSSRRTSGRSAIVAALGLGSLLAGGACSSAMNDQKTGETHFLACKKDSECSSLGSAYYCAVDHCEEKPDAGGGGASNGGSGPGGTSPGGAPGSAGTGGASRGGSRGDDFAECARRPPSTCSREETCQNLDCGGLEFDENGCGRATCKADADCATSERCTSMQCLSHGSCDVENGKCSCIFLADCGQGFFCNPVAETGPRGDWVTLEISKIQSPCPPSGCTTTWRVGPDGHVTGEGPGKTIDARLEDYELSQVKFIVDGVELRKGLRDGMPCFDDQPLDASVSLKLTLSTGDYMKNVSGCIGNDGVIAQMFRILAKF